MYRIPTHTQAIFRICDLYSFIVNSVIFILSQWNTAYMSVQYNKHLKLFLPANQSFEIRRPEFNVCSRRYYLSMNQIHIADGRHHSVNKYFTHSTTNEDFRNFGDCAGGRLNHIYTDQRNIPFSVI